MSAAVAAAAAAANAARVSSKRNSHHRSNQAANHRGMPFYPPSQQHVLVVPFLSRYESLKLRDWNEFEQYLQNHRPHLRLSQCSGLHVLEFLEDRFGDNKLHTQNCPFLVNLPEPQSPCSCSCPLKEAWSSLDGLVGRLRLAFEENGGRTEMNPFIAPVVRLYLREVKEAQAMARGIAPSLKLLNK